MDIIETSPNAVISHNIRGNPGYHPKLHDFLKQYMELEKRMLEAFYKETSDAVYTFHCYGHTQEAVLKSPLYSSPDTCSKAARESAKNTAAITTCVKLCFSVRQNISSGSLSYRRPSGSA